MEVLRSLIDSFSFSKDVAKLSQHFKTLQHLVKSKELSKTLSRLTQTPLISKTVFITERIKSPILCGIDVVTTLDGGSFVHAAGAAACSL